MLKTTKMLPYLQIYVQSLLRQVHGLHELLVLAGGLNILLLHHRVHFLHILFPHSLEPMEGVKLLILVQKLQDVGDSWKTQKRSLNI